jgi:D-tyrosyl-tRNA(Tyr) deacylase
VRAVVTRVSSARVDVNGEPVGEIGVGLLVLLGVAVGDGAADAEYLAGKIVGLRIFRDEAGAMNRSLAEVGGALLAVSQFTLLGDARKGRRPSFIGAARPEVGRTLYERFAAEVRALGIGVETGVFGADMEVISTNDGPVTILLDSRSA